MADRHPLTLAYARDYPDEVARFLASQGAEAARKTLDELPHRTAAAIVARLPHGYALRLLAAQDDQLITAWVNAATLDDALVQLLHLVEPRRTRILNGLSKSRTRRTLKRLLVYPERTVGALADPMALRLNASMSLAEAVEVLRLDDPGAKEAVWLVDDESGYLGLLDLCRVVVAESEVRKLEEFLIAVKPIRAETTIANARDLNAWLEHLELPVIDEHRHLLGSLSRTRLMGALAESSVAEFGFMEGISEMTHQYFRFMGICLAEVFGKQGKRR